MIGVTRRHLLSAVPHGALATALAPVTLVAQPPSSSGARAGQTFLVKAEQLQPRLNEFIQMPLGLVRPVSDSGQALGWRIDRTGDAEAIGSQFLQKKRRRPYHRFWRASCWPFVLRYRECRHRNRRARAAALYFW